MNLLSDEKIIDSWQKNASPWITAIKEQQIKSRQLSTDAVIVDTVMSLLPGSVIDIGCGEGWLSRRLFDAGIEVLGVDAVADLIKQAEKTGAGRYRTLLYEDMLNQLGGECFDIAVCNFSLLGKESVEHVFAAVRKLLNSNGYFVVQTLHPLQSCGEQPYRDGWREGSWAGFDSAFSDPAPWYFRTLESWTGLFEKYELHIKQIKEPVHPQTQRPASLLIVGQQK